MGPCLWRAIAKASAQLPAPLRGGVRGGVSKGIGLRVRGWGKHGDWAKVRGGVSKEAHFPLLQ